MPTPDTPTLVAIVALLAAVAYALWPRRKAEPVAASPVLTQAAPARPVATGMDAILTLEQLQLQGAGQVLEEQCRATGAARLARLGIAPATPPARPQPYPEPAEPFVLTSEPAVQPKAAKRAAKK